MRISPRKSGLVFLLAIPLTLLFAIACAGETKTVTVVETVIVEVPVEVEVIQEAEVETISPISYVAIGLGVILVVVSGVLYQRSKSS